MDFAEFIFTPQRGSCDDCANHYQKIKKQLPPCALGGCEFGKVDLWVSNHYAWELYQKVAGQVIVAGMGDILGIKFEAIQFLFDIYGIIDSVERLDLFEKIQIIDTARMKARSEQIVNKQNTAKQK